MFPILRSRASVPGARKATATASSTKTASRATSAQVVTVLSLGPKQPHDTVIPRTTADAIAPAFLFLAACEFAALIAIFAYRREPHGKPMDIG